MNRRRGFLRRPDAASRDLLQGKEDALLDARPAINSAVRAEQRGDALVLWVPIRRPWWLRGPLSWLLPWRPEKGIALDELGQEVWRECAGERRLEDVIESFAERHQIRFHEARLCVLAFLRSLVERNLVVLAIADESPSADRAADGPQEEAVS